MTASPRRRLYRTVAIVAVVAWPLGLSVYAYAARVGGIDTWWIELARYTPYYWLAVPCVGALLLSLWLGGAWPAIGLASPVLLATAVSGLVWQYGVSGGTSIRLMTYNIKAAGAQARPFGIEELGIELARSDPDIVVMQDANGLVVDRAGPAAGAGLTLFGLPHVYALGQYVVATRLPLHGCGAGRIDFGAESHRYLRCSIEVGGVAVTLVTAHFKSPRSGLSATRFQGWEGVREWRGNLADRLAQSRALAADLKTLPQPVIVAGDFNAPEASPVIQMLLHTGLRDAYSAAGRGYGYTYGQELRAGLSFLRIDHILVGPRIGVADCRVGGAEASAHRPVIADLVVSAPGSSVTGS